jgi:hypothetical protein
VSSVVGRMLAGLVEHIAGLAIGGILAVGLPEPVETAAGQERVGVLGVVGHLQAGAGFVEIDLRRFDRKKGVRTLFGPYLGAFHTAL